jgi:quinol-cytochrome oxidoreductase complex cytochrome b subunit
MAERKAHSNVSFPPTADISPPGDNRAGVKTLTRAALFVVAILILIVATMVMGVSAMSAGPPPCLPGQLYFTDIERILLFYGAAIIGLGAIVAMAIWNSRRKH